MIECKHVGACVTVNGIQSGAQFGASLQACLKAETRREDEAAGKESRGWGCRRGQKSPEEKAQNGGLAAATGAYQGTAAASWHMKRDILQHTAVLKRCKNNAGSSIDCQNEVQLKTLSTSACCSRQQFPCPRSSHKSFRCTHWS